MPDSKHYHPEISLEYMLFESREFGYIFFTPQTQACNNDLQSADIQQK